MVAVREGGNDEALAQAPKPADGVGPGVEAVPDAVEVGGLGLVEGVAELGEELIELARGGGRRRW